MRFSIVILLLISFSCQVRPALPDHSSRKSGDIKPGSAKDDKNEPVGDPTPNPDDSDSNESGPHALNFTKASIVQDAYDHTYGSLKISPGVSLSKTYEIYLSDTKMSSLMNNEKSKLKELCQSISVSHEGENLLLSWRSQYSIESKRMLKNLMLQGHDEIACVVSWKSATDKPAYFAIFDPIPTAEADILGTLFPKDALLEVIMAPRPLKTTDVWTPSNMERVDLDPSKSKLTAIKSIHASAVSMELSAEQGDSCIVDSSDAKNPSFNKDELKEFTYSFKTQAPFSLSTVAAIEAKDGTQKTCAEIAMSIEKSTVKSSTKCEIYARLLADNKVAQCQW
ncbi:MAG: hypothetical protein EOP04_16230, partial [Proteobacteria bacterium]